MKVAVAVAQTSVTWDVRQNLAAITSCLADTRAGELVVLPEACLSGYDDRLSGLDRLDSGVLAGAVDRLAGLAADKGIHLFCGSLLFEDGAWWNAAIYLAPNGSRWTYRKVNLATHERGAQAFVYLTNAVNPAVPAGVWSSHLISHAAANQRFVIACNIADPGQHCPSMIVSPRGEILGDLPATQPAVLRAVIDTEDVSDWYLSQRRTDVLRG